MKVAIYSDSSYARGQIVNLEDILSEDALVALDRDSGGMIAWRHKVEWHPGYGIWLPGGGLLTDGYGTGWIWLPDVSDPLTGKWKRLGTSGLPTL